MSPLLLAGLLLGSFAAATPLLLRLTGVGWLRMAAVPLSTLLFATSFTLAGNGPLLRPLVRGLGVAHSVLTPTTELRSSAPRAAPAPVAAGIGFDGASLRLTRGHVADGPRLVTAAGRVAFLGPHTHAGPRPIRRVHGSF